MKKDLELKMREVEELKAKLRESERKERNLAEERLTENFNEVTENFKEESEEGETVEEKEILLEGVSDQERRV